MTWKAIRSTGWGRVLSASEQAARPERAHALTTLAAERPCPAVGARRSYGDACLNDGGRVILTDRLDRVLAFDPEAGTLTAEAGTRLGDLARLLAPRGFLPPVLPGTGQATLGGAIAMDVHGKNHHHAGSFGEHLAEITLATAEGPRVLQPNDPLFRATVGGLGQTGPILSARLRLTRTKGDVVVVTERRMPDLATFLARLDGSEATHTVGWIDATATGDALGRGILEEAETSAGLVPPARRGRRVPLDAPSGLLSAPVVRAFNAAYHARVPARGRTVVKPIDDFFFPLDRIADWNRLYGRAGFHQFQCVVPPGAAEALRPMLARIARAAHASPLAVLKRMGPGRAGPMSFPMAGYTLAVDLPARAGADRLTAELNAMTVEAGGRVYLAKDSTATAGQAHAMYPDRAAWAELVNAHDPDRAFETDLTRRLKLRA